MFSSSKVIFIPEMSMIQNMMPTMKAKAENVLESLACFCALAMSPLLNSPLAMMDRTKAIKARRFKPQQDSNAKMDTPSPELNLPSGTCGDGGVNG